MGKTWLVVVAAMLVVMVWAGLSFFKRTQSAGVSEAASRAATAPILNPAATSFTDLSTQPGAEENVTVRDMKDKGVPVASNPERYIFERTANETLEDCVHDLGDPFTLFMFDSPMGNGKYNNLETWCVLTSHIKMLRVVEEGRKDPKLMRGFLRAELERDNTPELTMLELVAVSNNVQDIAHGRPGHSLDDNDPYYAKNRAFADPRDEFKRRMWAMGQCLYIMANIGDLSSNEDELSAFANLKVEPISRPEILAAWFIACDVAELLRHNVPVDKDLVDLTKSIRFNEVMRSKWNSVAQLDDPMLKMAQVDTSGIQTISVLEIPRTLPADVVENRELIAQKFIAFAKARAGK